MARLDAGAALAELEEVRRTARELAGGVEGIVGGSATGVDRELVAALQLAARSLEEASAALARLGSLED